jgi:propionyl-CoA synthetase
MGIERLPVKAGSPTKPVPGYDVRIFDGKGRSVPNNRDGIVAIKLPLPPGCLVTLWNDDEKFLDYIRPIPGFYVTGDSGHYDKDGYLFIMGRIDEVINVAGHRLSTGAMEETVAGHPDVAECAVIGVEDRLKGQLPFGFVVLKADSRRDHGKVIQELVQMVRAEIGAVACFNKCVVVQALPKTRSGKILRKTMSKIVDGKEYEMPSTIDDPGVLRKIEDAVAAAGYGKKG